jgi:amidophosphoribosyltransferase
LAYLALEGLITATGAAGSGFCTACLTGNYPVHVPGDGRADVDIPEVDLVHPCG